METKEEENRKEQQAFLSKYMLTMTWHLRLTTWQNFKGIIVFHNRRWTIREDELVLKCRLCLRLKLGGIFHQKYTLLISETSGIVWFLESARINILKYFAQNLFCQGNIF